MLVKKRDIHALAFTTLDEPLRAARVTVASRIRRPAVYTKQSEATFTAVAVEPEGATCRRFKSIKFSTSLYTNSNIWLTRIDQRRIQVIDHTECPPASRPLRGHSECMSRNSSAHI